MDSANNQTNQNPVSGPGSQPLQPGNQAPQNPQDSGAQSGGAAPSSNVPKKDPLGDLVFKTMPKGGYVVPKAVLKKPQPEISAENNIVSAATHAAALAPASQEKAPLAQSSQTANPSRTVEPSMHSVGISNNSGNFGKKTVLQIIIVVLVLLILGGGGYYAYSKFSGKKSNASLPAAALPGGGDANNSGNSQSQIPSSWMQKYFGAVICSDQNVCGDNADPDHDGLTNLEEYKLGTDPNNADSSGSGIADGDKVHVFNLNPLSNHTAGNPNYTDAQDLQEKYNSSQHRAFVADDLKQIAANIKQYGLHQPTTTTLGQDLVEFYTNGGSGIQANNANPTEALNRDTQRSDTIKQISFALIKYQQANGKYPDTSDFSAMIQDIQPILSAGRAINTTDPVNNSPYVYSYQSVNSGADFKLSYFSETQNQEIDTNAAEALQAYNKDQADQRDAKRENDLQQISTALNLYSGANANPSNPTQKVFPPEGTWKQAIQKYISSVPVDPKTNQDYLYSVSPDNTSFAVQTALEDPPAGDKGYVCTQDGCAYY